MTQGRSGTSIVRANSEAVITRIRVPKTSEIVADQIRAQIIRGELDEGTFLPPEGQLMENLGS
jgi:DNA-binding FadR family transcriptional regulator